MTFYVLRLNSGEWVGEWGKLWRPKRASFGKLAEFRSNEGGFEFDAQRSAGLPFGRTACPFTTVVKEPENIIDTPFDCGPVVYSNGLPSTHLRVAHFGPTPASAFGHMFGSPLELEGRDLGPPIAAPRDGHYHLP